LVSSLIAVGGPCSYTHTHGIIHKTRNMKIQEIETDIETEIETEIKKRKEKKGEE
jgi:hypothetical protein